MGSGSITSLLDSLITTFLCFFGLTFNDGDDDVENGVVHVRGGGGGAVLKTLIDCGWDVIPGGVV